MISKVAQSGDGSALCLEQISVKRHKNHGVSNSDGIAWKRKHIHGALLTGVQEDGIFVEIITLQ